MRFLVLYGMLLVGDLSVNSNAGFLDTADWAASFAVASETSLPLRSVKLVVLFGMLIVHCRLGGPFWWGKCAGESPPSGGHEGRLCSAHAARGPWPQLHLPELATHSARHALPALCQHPQVSCLTCLLTLHLCSQVALWSHMDKMV